MQIGCKFQVEPSQDRGNFSPLYQQQKHAAFLCFVWEIFEGCLLKPSAEDESVERQFAPRIKSLLPAAKTYLISIKLKKLRLEIKNSLFWMAIREKYSVQSWQGLVYLLRER